MVWMFLAFVALIPPEAGIFAEVRIGERPQHAEVEDRAEVDVEALGPLAGEHPGRAELVNRLTGEARVVRRRVRADVARRAGEAAADHPRHPAAGSG